MAYSRDVHFTESEFALRFKRANLQDFSPTQVYYQKKRFHLRWFGVPVIPTKDVRILYSRFMRDVYAGNAFLKVDFPTKQTPIPEKKELVGENIEEKKPIVESLPIAEVKETKEEKTKKKKDTAK